MTVYVCSNYDVACAEVSAGGRCATCPLRRASLAEAKGNESATSGGTR